MNFHTCVEGYLAQLKQNQQPAWRDFVRLYRKFFQTQPTWPTASELRQWQLSQKTLPHQANKALTLIRAAWNWAQAAGKVAGTNPTTGIKYFQMDGRDVVLRLDQVAQLVQALDVLPCGHESHKTEHTAKQCAEALDKLAKLLTVLLLTGCRLSEALQMQREHVNLESGEWYQPKTKNGKPHTTYLPTQARAALATIPHDGRYFFMGCYEHAWSVCGAEKIWRLTRVNLGLSRIRLHDFRRTVATQLYRATKDDLLVKRCLNHAVSGVTGQVYIRHSFEDVAQALQAQADRFMPQRAAGSVERSPVGDVSAGCANTVIYT